jgi:hypothetical protein
MNKSNNTICLFEEEDLTEEQNREIERYILNGGLSNALTIKEYAEFLTQFGDILFAHIEINYGEYNATDPRRLFWLREYQDEVNLMLRAIYPDITLPQYEYDDIEHDEVPLRLLEWDQQMVHFFPYNEYLFSEQNPILHILVRVQPTAFMKIKDSLLEFLSSLEDPTGRGFCKLRVERITSESPIIKKMALHRKDRFFRELTSYW